MPLSQYLRIALEHCRSFLHFAATLLSCFVFTCKKKSGRALLFGSWIVLIFRMNGFTSADWRRSGTIAIRAGEDGVAYLVKEEVG
jgi:hypothetical protein